MIGVEHLTKKYGDRTVVDNLCFTVETGQIVGFLGPNGAGKSTTMRMLTGFLSPTGGTATVAGFSITEQKNEVKKRIGYMPENVAVYKEMSVSSYLTFVGKAKGLSRTEAKSSVEKVIEQCGITQVASRPTGKLSRGYRQRLGLAQALVSSPEVIILDEPTVGLDPRQIIGIRSLIKSLAGNHTVILSTHILPEVSMTCERVVVINEGRLVEEDTPENLAEKLENECLITAEIIGPKDKIVETLSSLSSITEAAVTNSDESRHTVNLRMSPELEARTEVCRKIVESGWGLAEFRRLKISLEEIFIHLVNEDEERAAE